jgi:hypothetical protein
MNYISAFNKSTSEPVGYFLTQNRTDRATHSIQNFQLNKVNDIALATIFSSFAVSWYILNKWEKSRQ